MFSTPVWRCAGGYFIGIEKRRKAFWGG